MISSTLPLLENMRQLLGILLICFILLVSVSSCSCRPEPELDTSLLTDDPCAAPCWHNITPGISNEDDVRSQLTSSPFVRSGTAERIRTDKWGNPLDQFSWQGRGKELNRIYLQDGKALSIEIHLDYTLTLEEVVKKYGPPEYVYGHVYGVEKRGYQVYFDYPAQGWEFISYTYPIRVRDYTMDGKVGILSEDLKVTDVVYFAPTSLKGKCSEVYLVPQDAVENCMAGFYKWEGFGQIKLSP